MAISYHGDEQETRFLNVLRDLTEYGDRLVLIGGWLPFVYCRFLWRLEESVYLVKTTDIDLAVTGKPAKPHPPIAERLASRGGYVTEPVYPEERDPYEIWAVYGTGADSRMRLDFLIPEFGDPSRVQKRLLGPGVNCIPLETVDFMLEPARWTNVPIPLDGEIIRVNVLKPSAYFFIKGISFPLRSLADTDYKYKKDIWSMYFVLEYIPFAEKTGFFHEINAFKENEYYSTFLGNVRQFLSVAPKQGVEDLADFLKTSFPEAMIKKRIRAKFDELIDFLG